MKKIVINLNQKSIDNAISELKNYQKWLLSKTELLLQELANEGFEIASAKFQTAVYDGTNDVTCQIEQRGENKIALLAVGNSVLFIEFGTGVKYPDSHPESAKHNMIRGQFGHKLGRLPNGWRYKGEKGSNGEVITSGKHAGEVHTYGNPANMCMYLTMRELEEKFAEIAKRVYR